jgi:hypothetical protein
MDMPVRQWRISENNRGKIAPVQQTSQPLVYPAPANGLVTAIGLAEATEGAASMATNWLPTLKGLRIRGGSEKRGLLSLSLPIGSMFTYKFGSNQKMFAANANAIYDVTSPPAPPATVSPVVSGLTSGEWMTFQHTTTGGSFLCCFNGTDPRQVYDGASWATTPAITFSDATTSADIGAAFLFKQRQFLIKSGTFDAYYLGVNSIGGAAAVFPLGGVMKQGGGLLTGFTWSPESGDGLNMLACFVSTEGEIAVYAGDDPSTADSWGLQGVYSIGKPLGKNAVIRAGGDVFICTATGLIPLSQVFQRDRDTVSLSALSRPIDDIWRRIAETVSYGWSLTAWTEKSLVFVSFPFTAADPDTTFVLNVKTNKWSIVSGWQAMAYCAFQGQLYFGDAANGSSSNGGIWHADATGSDDGRPFKAVYLSHFMPAGGFGRRARAMLAHMYFEGKVNPIVSLFARADGNRTDPTGPDVTQAGEIVSEWDAGKWDEALWDVGTTTTKIQRRQNVRATGDALALGCVVTSGGSTPLDLEIDMGVLQVAGGEGSA